MKLIISAGDRRIQGFTHHDVRNLPGIDIVCDIYDLPTHVQENSCEEIQFTHALEHFPKAETQKVLALIHGLLAPGGKLYIEVPNFAWHAQLVQEGRERDAVYYAFGGQLDEYDFHKTGFSYNILKEELELAGFREIKIQDGSSLSATCIK